MPFGEIAGHLLGGLLRFLFESLIESIGEIVIMGPGELICRRLGGSSQPGKAAVVLVSLLFWAAVGSVVFLAYRMTR